MGLLGKLAAEWDVPPMDALGSSWSPMAAMKRQQLAPLVQILKQPADKLMAQIPNLVDQLSQKADQLAQFPDVKQWIEKALTSRIDTMEPAAQQQLQQTLAGVPNAESTLSKLMPNVTRRISEIEAPEQPAGVLPEEQQAYESEVAARQAERPVQALPEIEGYDTSPHVNANARDRQGNYYRIDERGRTYRYSGDSANPWVRAAHLDTEGSGPEYDQYKQGWIDKKVDQLLQQKMTSGQGVPTDPRQLEAWTAKQRQDLQRAGEKAFEQEARTAGASGVGLSRIDDLQRQAGGAVYFDRSGKAYARTEEGLQRVDPRAAQGLGVSRANLQNRREHNPRYWAAAMRAHQAAGEPLPAGMQQRLEEMEQVNPGFRDRVEAEAVADQALANMPENQRAGTNRTALVQRAYSQLTGTEAPSSDSRVTTVQAPSRGGQVLPTNHAGNPMSNPTGMSWRNPQTGNWETWDPDNPHIEKPQTADPVHQRIANRNAGRSARVPTGVFEGADGSKTYAVGHGPGVRIDQNTSDAALQQAEAQGIAATMRHREQQRTQQNARAGIAAKQRAWAAKKQPGWAQRVGGQTPSTTGKPPIAAAADVAKAKKNLPSLGKMGMVAASRWRKPPQFSRGRTPMQRRGLTLQSKHRQNRGPSLINRTPRQLGKLWNSNTPAESQQFGGLGGTASHLSTPPRFRALKNLRGI